MGLAGELSTIGLAEVFQNLAFNHLSGTLTISQGKQKAQVAFAHGRIKAVSVGKNKIDWVEVARFAGVAPEEALQKAASGNRRRSLKAFLAGCGGLDEAGYDTAVRTHVEDLILPLFGWKNGSFEFEEGKVNERAFDKEQFGCGVDLDPQGVAMEAARRHDEWNTLSSLIPGQKDILVRTDGSFEPLEEADEAVLALIDGTRRLVQVVEDSGRKQYDVLTTIGRLVEAGRVVVAEPADLQALAQRARMAGDINLAAQRYEMALELDPADVTSRRDLVKLYEKSDRKHDAARELMKLADLHAERGDMESAKDAQERAAILAPGDLDVLERIFRFHEARGAKVRAAKAGEALGAALVAQEMYEDALPLYERLLDENPDHDALHEAVAACLVHVGETAKATQHLMMVAEHAEEQGDFRGARRAFRRVLTVNPECAEAQERLDQIDTGELEARRARKKRRKVYFVMLCILAAIGAQGWREWRAQGALHDAATTAALGLAKDNSDRGRIAAMKPYLEVGKGHVLTRARVQAHAALERMLQAEVETIKAALAKAPDARTTSEIAFSVGRAETLLKALDKIEWPGDLAGRWQAERTAIVKTLETIR